MKVEIKDRSEYGRQHDRRLVWSPIQGGKLVLLEVVVGDNNDFEAYIEVNADDIAALGRAFTEPVRDR